MIASPNPSFFWCVRSQFLSKKIFIKNKDQIWKLENNVAFEKWILKKITNKFTEWFLLEYSQVCCMMAYWFFPKIIVNYWIPLLYVSQRNRGKTALRAYSFAGLRTNQVFVMYCLSSFDPGLWDRRDPVTVETSLCPSTFQDLAEQDPVETDVAFCSIVVARAARLPTICSIFVIFASYGATLWECVRTQLGRYGYPAGCGTASTCRARQVAGYALRR